MITNSEFENKINQLLTEYIDNMDPEEEDIEDNMFNICCTIAKDIYTLYPEKYDELGENTVFDIIDDLLDNYR